MKPINSKAMKPCDVYSRDGAVIYSVLSDYTK